MQKNLPLVFLLALCWCGYQANAQSVGINNSGSPAHASAILDVQATNWGMLVPRMAATPRAAIATPATGLLVYQTDAPAGFQFYNGTAWVPISTTGWTLTGNAAGAADFVVPPPTSRCAYGTTSRNMPTLPSAEGLNLG